jgi:hypothetical protein
MVALNILADQMVKCVYRLAVDLRALLLREQHPDLKKAAWARVTIEQLPARAHR